MIDPIDSLSFSIHSNPGVYAVLVGSGISRSAKIPTGWEITLELVRKWAAVLGEDCGEHPAEWYIAKAGREPDYSEILDGLAKSPAARQQLLKPYWEPTEQERDEGAKLPTPAHRAIADLAAKGFIKVIVTTNFDRLIETALADVGVVPSVLSTSDQIHGAVPLIHSKCTVVKVHGDYLDTRIKNTPEELTTYSPEFNSLLDQIFDQFGLIICGWSADWDVALRSAIMRAPSRRYAMYWAARGVPGIAAQELMVNRQAIQIQIDGADSFFQTVAAKVQSLDEYSKPHPLSVEVAVASLKRFMSDDKFRIQHEDLISTETENVIPHIGSKDFPAHAHINVDRAYLTNRVRQYESRLTTLLSMAVQGGYWAQQRHYRAWTKALLRLIEVRSTGGGLVLLLNLERYPAALLFYVLCIGAIEGENLSFLKALCEVPVVREHDKDALAVQLLPSGCLFDANENGRLLEGMDRRHAPMSDWIHDFCREIFRRLIPNDNQFAYIFDKTEILVALSYGVHSDREPSWHWVPPGAYGYRHANRNRVISEIEASLEKLGNESPYVQAGLFGDTKLICEEQVNKLKDFVLKLRWY
jgi:hypothetical protein